jgi:abhydrolase domain-containing protein 17
MLFQPPNPTYQDDSNLIWIDTRDGNRIPAFFINRNAPITLLFSHGNAEDLGGILRYFNYFGDRIKANIFAYDYSGYGLSTGTACESTAYTDAEAAFTYLRDVLHIPWDQIVLFGRSLGSAVSTHLASLTPVRGLILQCPMLSMYRILFNLKLTLPGDKLCSVDRLKNIWAPIMVLHGTRDEIVPFWHGLELYEQCHDKSCPPYWVRGGTHNDVELLDKATFLIRLNEFLRTLSETPPSDKIRSQAVFI